MEHNECSKGLKQVCHPNLNTNTKENGNQPCENSVNKPKDSQDEVLFLKEDKLNLEYHVENKCYKSTSHTYTSDKPNTDEGTSELMNEFDNYIHTEISQDITSGTNRESTPVTNKANDERRNVETPSFSTRAQAEVIILHQIGRLPFIKATPKKVHSEITTRAYGTQTEKWAYGSNRVLGKRKATRAKDTKPFQVIKSSQSENITSKISPQNKNDIGTNTNEESAILNNNEKEAITKKPAEIYESKANEPIEESGSHKTSDLTSVTFKKTTVKGTGNEGEEVVCRSKSETEYTKFPKCFMLSSTSVNDETDSDDIRSFGHSFAQYKAIESTSFVHNTLVDELSGKDNLEPLSLIYQVPKVQAANSLSTLSAANNEDECTSYAPTFPESYVSNNTLPETYGIPKTLAENIGPSDESLLSLPCVEGASDTENNLTDISEDPSKLEIGSNCGEQKISAHNSSYDQLDDVVSKSDKYCHSNKVPVQNCSSGSAIADTALQKTRAISNADCKKPKVHVAFSEGEESIEIKNTNSLEVQPQHETFERPITETAPAVESADEENNKTPSECIINKHLSNSFAVSTGQVNTNMSFNVSEASEPCITQTGISTTDREKVTSREEMTQATTNVAKCKEVNWMTTVGSENNLVENCKNNLTSESGNRRQGSAKVLNMEQIQDASDEASTSKDKKIILDYVASSIGQKVIIGQGKSTDMDKLIKEKNDFGQKGKGSVQEESPREFESATAVTEATSPSTNALATSLSAKTKLDLSNTEIMQNTAQEAECLSNIELTSTTNYRNADVSSEGNCLESPNKMHTVQSTLPAISKPQNNCYVRYIDSDCHAPNTALKTRNVKFLPEQSSVLSVQHKSSTALTDPGNHETRGNSEVAVCSVSEKHFFPSQNTSNDYLNTDMHTSFENKANCETQRIIDDEQSISCTEKEKQQVISNNAKKMEFWGQGITGTNERSPIKMQRQTQQFNPSLKTNEVTTPLEDNCTPCSKSENTKKHGQSRRYTTIKANAKQIKSSVLHDDEKVISRQNEVATKLTTLQHKLIKQFINQEKFSFKSILLPVDSIELEKSVFSNLHIRAAMVSAKTLEDECMLKIEILKCLKSELLTTLQKNVMSEGNEDCFHVATVSSHKSKELAVISKVYGNCTLAINAEDGTLKTDSERGLSHADASKLTVSSISNPKSSTDKYNNPSVSSKKSVNQGRKRHKKSFSSDSSARTILATRVHNELTFLPRHRAPSRRDRATFHVLPSPASSEAPMYQSKHPSSALHFSDVTTLPVHPCPRNHFRRRCNTERCEAVSTGISSLPTHLTKSLQDYVSLPLSSTLRHTKPTTHSSPQRKPHSADKYDRARVISPTTTAKDQRKGGQRKYVSEKHLSPKVCRKQSKGNKGLHSDEIGHATRLQIIHENEKLKRMSAKKYRGGSYGDSFNSTVYFRQEEKKPQSILKPFSKTSDFRTKKTGKTSNLIKKRRSSLVKKNKSTKSVTFEMDSNAKLKKRKGTGDVLRKKKKRKNYKRTGLYKGGKNLKSPASKRGRKGYKQQRRPRKKKVKRLAGRKYKNKMKAHTATASQKKKNKVKSFYPYSKKASTRNGRILPLNKRTPKWQV